ncbi:MAG: HAMP domain-containing histidine kinase [Acaryochloridaceae cyanobacterium RL_2_7]|nr:HAMP domain-containing histidine kinase [Acaryochloridaceae cyanobacterium RL_2_7]
MDAERFQLIFPLRHDNAVLGILMVARWGKGWSKEEQAQVEQVANSLSLACVLDQRSQWLSQSGYEKQALLSEEHQRLGKLLHQFRNPLTALRTLGKLMLRRMIAQDPNRNFAESIVQQSDRLESMLREFSQTLNLGEEAIEALDDNWSVLSSQKEIPLLPSAGVISGGALTFQPCWLSEILEMILASAIGRLEEKQLTLEHLLSEDLPPIRGDLQALNEVFSNLVDNAIKYTPNGGKIAVILCQSSLCSSPSSFQEVYISDTGYGIPRADLEMIFMGKYRGIQESSEIPGTGLGLSIVKDLLQRMDARIQAFSPAIASPVHPNLSPLTSSRYPGSTFLITFLEQKGTSSLET